jgi:hypothetical protein
MVGTVSLNCSFRCRAVGLDNEEQMSQFKVGDRVRLKGFANLQGESTVVEGIKGYVTRLYGERFVVHIHRADILGGNYEVHVYPSQCRRLVKKPRRRMWINIELTRERGMESFDMGTTYSPWVSFKEVNLPGWVEFVEVRKKK